MGFQNFRKQSKFLLVLSASVSSILISNNEDIQALFKVLKKFQIIK